MINKIIWTKSNTEIEYSQFDFSLPSGYKVYATEDIYISTKQVRSINLQVSIYSEKPITLLYTKALVCYDFDIIDPHQMIGAHYETPLFINVINPHYTEGDDEWLLKKGSLIANMIPIDSSYTNLFEVSNKVFKEYV